MMYEQVGVGEEEAVTTTWKGGPAVVEEEDEDNDVLMIAPKSGRASPTKSTGTSGEIEKCGGYVYVSSEWDVKSHPAGIRGQRVVVWVVHEGGDDPVQ